MSYLELWTSACLHTSLQRAQCCWEGWKPGTSAPRLPPNNLEEPWRQTVTILKLVYWHRSFSSLSYIVWLLTRHNKSLNRHQSGQLTRLEQEDLVILAQFHEPWNALGKLHHVLDCMGNLDGTLLPQHVPGLQPNTSSSGLHVLFLRCYIHVRKLH